MNIDEIKRNAPCDATSYLIWENKIYYLRFDDGKWKVWVIYDCGGYWGLANQYALSKNVEKIKPL